MHPLIINISFNSYLIVIKIVHLKGLARANIFFLDLLAATSAIHLKQNLQSHALIPRSMVQIEFETNIATIEIKLKRNTPFYIHMEWYRSLR